MVQSSVLSAGHARALINATDPIALAEQVVRKGLNVRQTEQLSQAARPDAGGKARPSRPAKDADVLGLERELSEQLGLAVTVNVGSRGGELVIKYKTLEQLDDLVRLFNRATARPPVN
jgi:ParB family chromosome partitioning protein